MTRVNPYECPYCHGPKAFRSRHCIRCQAVAIDNYRAEAQVAQHGPTAYARWKRDGVLPWQVTLATGGRRLRDG